MTKENKGKWKIIEIIKNEKRIIKIIKKKEKKIIRKKRLK